MTNPYINYGRAYRVETNVKVNDLEKLRDHSGETLPYPMKDTFIVEDEDGNRFICLPHDSLLDPKDSQPRISIGRTVAMNVGSGLGMASTFTWLDKNMGFGQSSNIVDLVCSNCFEKVTLTIIVDQYHHGSHT